jgi:hypothetical protein
MSASSLLRTGTTDGPMEAGGLYVPVAVQASAYTANPGDFVPVDTTSAGVTVTLPAAPQDQSVVAVKMVKQGSTNTVTISAGGSDVFNLAGGSQTATLTLLNQLVLLQYEAANAVWYVIDALGLAQLDLRYTQTAAAPGYGESVAGFGLALASCQPLYTAAATGTNETLFLARMTARESASITKLGCWITTAGVTPGAGVNLMAIFTAAGAQLQVTGDLTTAIESTGIVEGTITSQAVVAGTDYWIGLLTSYSGTAPHFAGASAAAAIPEINGVYSAGSVASQATMPATITPSSLTGLATPPFLYGR